MCEENVPTPAERRTSKRVTTGTPFSPRVKTCARVFGGGGREEGAGDARKSDDNVCRQRGENLGREKYSVPNGSVIDAMKTSIRGTGEEVEWSSDKTSPFAAVRLQTDAPYLVLVS